MRPLILFQAQSALQTDPHRLTYEVIEKHLTEERRVPEKQIAVHSGSRKDLDVHDIDHPECPVPLHHHGAETERGVGLSIRLRAVFGGGTGLGHGESSRFSAACSACQAPSAGDGTP